MNSILKYIYLKFLSCRDNHTLSSLIPVPVHDAIPGSRYNYIHYEQANRLVTHLYYPYDNPLLRHGCHLPLPSLPWSGLERRQTPGCLQGPEHRAALLLPEREPLLLLGCSELCCYPTPHCRERRRAVDTDRGLCCCFLTTRECNSRGWHRDICLLSQPTVCLSLLGAMLLLVVVLLGGDYGARDVSLGAVAGKCFLGRWRVSPAGMRQIDFRPKTGVPLIQLRRGRRRWRGLDGRFLTVSLVLRAWEPRECPPRKGGSRLHREGVLCRPLETACCRQA